VYKLHKNFLKSENFLFLKNEISSTDFPWYIQQKSIPTSKNRYDFHFGHVFYEHFNIKSRSFNTIKPLIENLKIKSLIRVKANLYPICNKIFIPDLHVDQYFNCKVAIFYVNTNNGYTMLESNKIKSVENTILLFESSKKHYGTSSTDTQSRITINFNYF